mgnify:CR=1 FL=1
MKQDWIRAVRHRVFSVLFWPDTSPNTFTEEGHQILNDTREFYSSLCGCGVVLASSLGFEWNIIVSGSLGLGSIVIGNYIGGAVFLANQKKNTEHSRGVCIERKPSP